jgi:hypothetical protein
MPKPSKPRGGGAGADLGKGMVSLKEIEIAVRKVQDSVRSYPGGLPVKEKETLLKFLEALTMLVQAACEREDPKLQYIPFGIGNGY